MAGCYPESCCEYAVTPVLTPMYPRRCCEEQPLCYPCLPCCPKGIYCCETKPPKPCRKCERDRCHEEVRCESRHRDRSPPRYRRPCSRSPPPPRCCSQHKNCHEPCCYPACKPVKTQYVIPCYRYEDGRINQPTVLMRRACEVAVGSRIRRKPFVEQSYSADECKEVHRYASKDEWGNCCFHYEKKNTKCNPCCDAPPPCSQFCNSCHDPCSPRPASGKCNSLPCVHQAISSPPCCNYMDCVAAGPINNQSGSCCYYC